MTKTKIQNYVILKKDSKGVFHRTSRTFERPTLSSASKSATSSLLNKKTGKVEFYIAKYKPGMGLIGSIYHMSGTRSKLSKPEVVEIGGRKVKFAHKMKVHKLKRIPMTAANCHSKKD